MNNLLRVLFLVLLFTSCRIHKTEIFNTVVMDEDAVVYFNSNIDSETRETIIAGEPFYMVTTDNNKRGFKKVKYKGKYGYLLKPNYRMYAATRASQSYAVRDSSTHIQSSRTSTYTPARSSGGTVQVKGYYRKNGTYVRPHTRSAPRRR